MIPTRGPISSLLSSRMMWGAVAIVRPLSSAGIVQSSLGSLELRNLRSCLRASTAAIVPARWRRLIAATIPMLSLSQILATTRPTQRCLFETFGPRVIGLHISRNGDGINPERRPVKQGTILVYTVGRTYLIELFHTELQADQVRIVDGPTSQRAYAQLEGLETEMRDTGVVYTCPPGQHDDLGISCAMLAWAARHPHLSSWVGTAFASRRPRVTRQKFNWSAVT